MKFDLSQFVTTLHRLFILDGVVELIEATGAKVIFLAPYAPEYNNPIETMFHVDKSSLRLLQHMSWIDAHVLSFESVKPAKARALFSTCLCTGLRAFR